MDIIKYKIVAAITALVILYGRFRGMRIEDE